MKRYYAQKMTASQYAYILRLTVQKNIKQQYRNSFLGVIWTVLNPLLNMLVMAFVFSTILGRPEDLIMDYSCYLLAGNIIFGLVRTSTTMSLPCIVENRDLMTKTRVPSSIFPLARTVTALTNFGFSMIALLGVMLVQFLCGKKVVFGFAMLQGLLILPPLFLFGLGISYILSVIYVKFRDIKHIYGVFLTLWTYATPLFYSINAIGDATVVTVIRLNPMTNFVEFFRNVFVGGVPADWIQFAICCAWGIGMFLIGFLIFNSFKKNFVVNI